MTFNRGVSDEDIAKGANWFQRSPAGRAVACHKCLFEDKEISALEMDPCLRKSIIEKTEAEKLPVCFLCLSWDKGTV